MDIVDPCVDPALMPEGSIPKILNTPNNDCLDLPAIITPKRAVITRWRLTDDERARLLAGEDIYLTIWGLPIRPVHLAVGVCDWTQA